MADVPVSVGAASSAAPLIPTKVPFDFQFAGVNLPAGQYRVDSSHGRLTGLILVQNQETRKAALSVGVPNQISRDAEYGRPHLLFRCGQSGCLLNQVRTPYEQYAYPVKSGPNQHVASVPLTSVKAD